MNARLKRIVWILNSIGLLIYMVWLYTMSGRDILRSQDGILFFLPCIPFFFVYMLLIPQKPRTEEQEKEGSGKTGQSGEQNPPPAR